MNTNTPNAAEPMGPPMRRPEGGGAAVPDPRVVQLALKYVF